VAVGWELCDELGEGVGGGQKLVEDEERRVGGRLRRYDFNVLEAHAGDRDVLERLVHRAKPTRGAGLRAPGEKNSPSTRN
jgi:hypothetical protein